MIEILIGIIVGYIIFKLISIFVEVKIITEEELDKIDQSEFQEPKNIIICKIERHDDMFYVWNLQTDTFLVQGKTMDDIVKFFTKHHPNTKVIFDKGDLDGIKA